MRLDGFAQPELPSSPLTWHPQIHEDAIKRNTSKHTWYVLRKIGGVKRTLRAGVVSDDVEASEGLYERLAARDNEEGLAEEFMADKD